MRKLQDCRVFTHWETHIDRRVDLFRLCLYTANFAPFHALLAGDTAQHIDSAATQRRIHEISAARHGKTGPSQDDLMQVNIELTRSIGENFSHQLRSFASLVSKEHEPDRLEEAFEGLVDSLKGHSVRAWTKARDDAKAVIRQFPPEARRPAAHLFTAALDATSSLSEQQMKSLHAILNALPNFDRCDYYRRVQIAIRKALASDQSSQDIAIDWVRSLFGHRKERSTVDDAFDEPESGLLDDPVPPSGSTRLSFHKTAQGWNIQHTD